MADYCGRPWLLGGTQLGGIRLSQQSVRVRSVHRRSKQVSRECRGGKVCGEVMRGGEWVECGWCLKDVLQFTERKIEFCSHLANTNEHTLSHLNIDRMKGRGRYKIELQKGFIPK